MAAAVPAAAMASAKSSAVASTKSAPAMKAAKAAVKTTVKSAKATTETMKSSDDDGSAVTIVRPSITSVVRVAIIIGRIIV